jgi:hypothetical protein
MMREKENLSFGAQLTKNLKPSRRASIIKIDKQVVCDERKGVRTLKLILTRSALL